MVKYIDNDFELESILSDAIDAVVGYIFPKIKQELQNSIKDVVYDAYTPVSYQRTYQFLEAWKTDIKKNSNRTEGILEFDPMSMEYNSELYQHGSAEDDFRKYLATMIFEGFGYAFDSENMQNKAYSKPRDAWTPFIEKIDNGLLEKWILEGFQKTGIEVKKWGGVY